jgi:hypothetical protein
MPDPLLDPNAAGVFSTSLLTALLDHFVATGKMTKAEVADILVGCKDKWTGHSTRRPVMEATKYVDGLLARFSS